MKRTTVAIFLLLSLFINFLAFAEIPQGYYNSIEGTKQSVLKSALHKIIQPKVVLKYGGKGAGYTWEGFSQTDKSNDGYVLDRYSNEQRKFNGINAVSGMHIEHSFANSWWGGINNNAYKDLHHLYPSDASANMSKNNNPIGIVTETGGFDNGVIKVGQSSLVNDGELVKVWEPSDRYKGDFARTYMYMATCYEDYYNLWQSAGLLMLEKNTYPVFKDWVIKILLKWNNDDPVSEEERTRNETVYSIQGNRNPFIDHAELAEYIWGDKQQSTYYTISYDTPTLFIPDENEKFDLGVQTTILGTSKDISIRGCGLNNTLDVTVSNPDFTLNKNSFSPQEVLNGATLTVSCNPLSAGQKDCIITLKSGDITRNITISANFINGIPAYDATDINCSTYAKSFVASWSKIPDIESYTLDVYTKDNNEKTSIKDYPITLNTTESKVSVTKANTTYYYTVSSGNLSSNEVKAIMPEIPPVFSTNTTSLSFYSKVNCTSYPQKVTITAMQVPNNTTNISIEEPFELSTDGNEWSNSIQTKGSTQSFFIRMGKIATEGFCEGEAVLATEGVDDIVLNLSGEINNKKAFFENFETGTKSKYEEDDVKCTAAEWKLNNALIGSLDNDKKNDSYSLRLKGTGMATTNVPKHDGIGTLSFYAGSYGSDTNMALKVEYSIDGEISWQTVIDNLPLTKGEWKQYSYKINIDGDAIFRFSANGSTSKRINIDDITVDDFIDPAGVNDIVNDLSKIEVVKKDIIINSVADNHIKIYDTTGQLILEQDLIKGNNTINTNLLSGCYIIVTNNAASYKVLIP